MNKKGWKVASQKLFQQHVQQLTEEVEEIIFGKLMANVERINQLMDRLNLKDWEQYLYDENKQMLNGHSNGETATDMNNKAEVSTKEKPPKIKYPSNRKIMELCEEVMPFTEEFYRIATSLCAWLDLQKKKYETGNTFGSEVIDEIANIISHKMSNATIGRLDYIESRSKVCSKIFKYPGNEDAVKAVELIDRNQVRVVEVGLIWLKNSYATIYDVCIKNWDMIVASQNGNGFQDLY